MPTFPSYSSTDRLVWTERKGQTVASGVTPSKTTSPSTPEWEEVKLRSLGGFVSFIIRYLFSSSQENVLFFFFLYIWEFSAFNLKKIISGRLRFWPHFFSLPIQWLLLLHTIAFQLVASVGWRVRQEVGIRNIGLAFATSGCSKEISELE